MLRTTAIAKELATIERKLKETDNATLKEALKKKETRLKAELKDQGKSTAQLAKTLLAQREVVKQLSKVEFNDLIRRLSKKPEYSFLKTMSKSTVKNDLEVTAKPVGWRFKGRGNYDKPTKAEIIKGKKNGTVYREVRPRRSDVSQVVKLKDGGSMYAEGGMVKVGDYVHINEKTARISEDLGDYVIITSIVGRNKQGKFYPYMFKVSKKKLIPHSTGKGWKVEGKKTPIKPQMSHGGSMYADGGGVDMNKNSIAHSILRIAEDYEYEPQIFTHSDDSLTAMFRNLKLDLDDPMIIEMQDELSSLGYSYNFHEKADGALYLYVEKNQSNMNKKILSYLKSMQTSEAKKILAKYDKAREEQGYYGQRPAIHVFTIDNIVFDGKKYSARVQQTYTYPNFIRIYGEMPTIWELDLRNEGHKGDIASFVFTKDKWNEVSKKLQGSMYADGGGVDVGDLTKLNYLEDYVYENMSKIKQNKKDYGFEDVDEITNPYDFANLLGVDSRIFKDADIPFYAEYVDGLLESDEEDDDKMATGGSMYADEGGVDPMQTVNEIARLSGLRSIAVAEWGDKNNINLYSVLKDLKSKKIKGIDLMTAIVGNPNNKYSKELIAKYSKMSDGGSMYAEGGNIDEKQKIVDELNKLIEYRNKQVTGSKEYDKYSERITNLKNKLTELSKMAKSGSMYAEGGSLEKESVEMINNQATSAKHHIEELKKVLSHQKEIEPWVIAKMQRATTDLSDITHYLDGKDTKMAFGGVVYDLSNDAIDRMDGLAPIDAMQSLRNSVLEISRSFEEEGFEKDEIASYLSYMIVSHLNKMMAKGGNIEVGDTIRLKTDLPYMASLSSLMGKDLEVVDVKEVYFASGPKKFYHVIVDGDKHEVNEDFVEHGKQMAKGGQLTAAQQKKFDQVMHEWGQGKLHSGKNGPIVKDQDQAVAIAYAEARGMKKMAKGGYLEGREEFEGFKYQIYYSPTKGMYSVSDNEGVFKGDNNYFKKYDQAKEHAEISISSMLSDKDEMAKGGGVDKYDALVEEQRKLIDQLDNTSPSDRMYDYLKKKIQSLDKRIEKMESSMKAQGGSMYADGGGIEGWRLPTKEEFETILYPNKSKIPNLKEKEYYWSNTYNDTFNVAWVFRFNDADTRMMSILYESNLMIVRNLSNTSDNSIIIENLEVYKHNLDKMTWYEANKKVSELNSKMMQGGSMYASGSEIKSLEKQADDIQDRIDFLIKDGIDKHEDELIQLGEDKQAIYRKINELKGKKYAEGGSVDESVEMIEIQSKEAKHHAEELANAIKGKKHIEPWVIAKMERATTDLSDITHYLEGQKEKMEQGGQIGSTITFRNFQGDIREGEIIDILSNRGYEVRSGYGTALVKPDEIISFGSKMMHGGSIEVGDKVKASKEYGGKSGTVIEKRGSFVVVEYANGKSESYHESDLIKKMARGKAFAFGGLIDEGNLSTGMIIKMSEFVPTKAEYDMISNARIIMKDLLNEGFEKDEVFTYIAHVLIRNVKVEGSMMAQGGGLKSKLEVIDYREYVNPDYVEVTLSNNKKLQIKRKYVKGGARFYQTILQSLDSYNENAKAKQFIDNIVNAMADNLKESKMAKGGEVSFTDYKGESIMFEPHFKEYYVGDAGPFSTIDEAKEYIDGGSKTPDSIKDAYKKGLFARGGGITKSPRKKFLLYTNPNNSTNKAYVAIGQDVKDVLKDSKEYSGSYTILYQGTGTNEDLQKAKSMYSNYSFGNHEEIMAQGGKLTAAQQKKFDKVMHEWGQGKLHSGNNGPIVKDQDQALAIAYAEANASKMAKGGYLEGREEFEDYKYQIWYSPTKGMYLVSDSEGVFKGDNNYFKTYDQAKEHAEISISSMLGDKKQMMHGGDVSQEIKSEYSKYKKASISNLRAEWSRNQKVGDPKELNKEGLITDLLIFKYGKKRYNEAFGNKMGFMKDGGSVSYKWIDPRVKQLTDKLSKENKNDIVKIVIDYHQDKDQKKAIDQLREVGAKYSRKNDNETARNIAEIATIIIEKSKKSMYKVAYAGKGFYGITNGGEIIGEMSKEEAQKEADKKNSKSTIGWKHKSK